VFLNLVKEAEDPLSNNIQESGKNDTENVLDPLDVSPNKITTITDNVSVGDAQSDPECGPEDSDNDDEDSAGEADDDSHDLDFTSQSPRNKEKFHRSPVKPYRKSISFGSEPKNSTRWTLLNPVHLATNQPCLTITISNSNPFHPAFIKIIIYLENPF
jgi:hypothetical protein